MDIKQLNVFCAVAEKRSFSRAGGALGLTQPTVSFQISSLEEDLGTRLFDRGVKGVTITKSGEILYQYARRILRLVGEAKQAIDQLTGLIKGELTIGASTIPGEYILPELMCQFKDRYPGIQINLIIGDTKGIINKVMDNEVEVGVVGAKEKGDKLEFTEFVSDKLVLIAPAHCRWFEHDTITVDQLKGVPFVLRESGSGTRASMRQRLSEVGMSEDEFNIVMRLGSTAAVRKAVECGAGVSIVSERVVQSEMKLGLIKQINIEGLDLSRDFYIVHRRRRTLSPAAGALLEFLGGG